MDKKLTDLKQFIGTERYFDVMGIKVTDGVKYVMDNGYSWLVTDAVAVIMTKLLKEPFLSIKLLLNADDSARMVITDGNDKTLYEQKYGWTDAKVNVEMFCTNGVLMLTTEY